MKDVLLALAENATAATTALLVEFAADKAGSRPGRYEFFLCSLVKSMLADPVKNSKRLARILCDAPALPDACLALILGLLENKVRREEEGVGPCIHSHRLPSGGK